MLNKMMEFVARIALGKQLVSAIAFLHDKADGRRSEIIAAILAIVHLLKVVAIIPAPVADGIEKALLTLLPLTLADRASKVMATVDRVVPAASVAPVADAPKPAA